MKKVGIYLITVVLILGLVGNVFAISGSIGNARMVLHAKTGDTISRTILVKNVNDIAVNIKVFGSEDNNTNIITVKDSEFTLQPGEQKDAAFTIKVRQVGTTENRINILFTPVNGKNGVGLGATVIIVAEKGDSLLDIFGSSNGTNSTTTEPSIGVTPSLTGKVVGFSRKNLILAISILTTIVIILLLIALYLYSKKINKKKKRVNSKPKKSRRK